MRLRSVRWVRRLAHTALVFALVIPAAACGTDDNRTDRATVTGTAEGAEPGTTLTSELVSPPGTVLLGGGFRNQDESAALALMIITGDPSTAVNDLMHQLSAAGYALSSWKESGHACTAEKGRHVYLLTEKVPADAEKLHCFISAKRVNGDRTSTIDLEATVGTEQRPYLSHLRISKRSYVHDPATEQADAEPAPVAPPVPSPIQPQPFVPDTTKPGSRFAQPFAPSSEEYELQEHSRLAGPPAPLTCPTGSFIAVVELEDAAGTDDYDEMLRNAAFNMTSREDAEEDQEFTIGEVWYLYRTYSAAGGGEASIAAIRAPDQPTYLMLTRCND